MSTQNMKRMTTWIWFRYMGSLPRPTFSDNIPPTELLIGLHLPTFSRIRSRSSPGENGGNRQEHLRRAVSQDVLASAIRTRGFDMAKRYP
jgi:hypothetical protein